MIALILFVLLTPLFVLLVWQAVENRAARTPRSHARTVPVTDELRPPLVGAAATPGRPASGRP